MQNTLFGFTPSDYLISTAALGVATPTQLPTSPLAPNLPSGWFDLGLMSDAGVTEGHTFNESKVFDMKGQLFRIIRNQEERPWTFECLQDDAVVSGLMYPGSSVQSSGGTAEVQQIAISGSPTGGTFTPQLAGFPAVPPQANNVTPAALQTALQNAWDLNVTVAGTAGTSYNITFPASEGNVPQLTVVNNLTGGTSPAAAVTTTTPGVTGVNSRGIGSGIAQNLRQFCIDMFDGTKCERNLVTLGEAVWQGTTTYSGSAAKIAQFTVNTFKDPATSLYFNRLDNKASQGIQFA